MKTTHDYPARKTGGCLTVLIIIVLFITMLIKAQEPKSINEYIRISEDTIYIDSAGYYKIYSDSIFSTIYFINDSICAPPPDTLEVEILYSCKPVACVIDGYAIGYWGYEYYDEDFNLLDRNKIWDVKFKNK